MRKMRIQTGKIQKSGRPHAKAVSGVTVCGISRPTGNPKNLLLTLFWSFGPYLTITSRFC